MGNPFFLPFKKKFERNFYIHVGTAVQKNMSNFSIDHLKMITYVLPVLKSKIQIRNQMSHLNLDFSGRKIL